MGSKGFLYNYFSLNIISLQCGRIVFRYPENVSRQSAGFNFESRLLQDDCPLKGRPRCPPAARRYRTADGTCNNFNKPWRGASLLPMQRFLPPVYEDGKSMHKY